MISSSIVSQRLVLQRVYVFMIGSAITSLSQRKSFHSIHWNIVEIKGTIFGATISHLLTDNKMKFEFASIFDHIQPI